MDCEILDNFETMEEAQEYKVKINDEYDDPTINCYLRIMNDE